MIRTINVNGQPVEVNTSAGWLYAYRERFGHDILPDLMPILESVLNAAASILEEADGEINQKTALAAMNNENFVQAFISLAGMEFTTVFNIFWAMAYNKDQSIPAPREYMNQFERFPLDEVLPELFYALVDSSVSSKNAERLLTMLKKAKKLTEKESLSTPSPSQESTED